MRKYSWPKIVLFTIPLLVFFMASPLKIHAVEEYEPLQVSIPFEYHDESDHSHEGTICISYSAGEPAPDAEKKTLRDGEKGAFSLTVTKPGNYQYTLYEEAATDTGISYDKNRYTVTVCVINGEKEGTLSYTLAAENADSGGKPDSISFTDQDIKEDKENTGDKSNTKTGKKSKGSRTADQTPVREYLMLAVSSAILFAILFAILLKREKKEKRR